MTSPEPGWYPDPAGAAQARFWDGAQWTSQVQQFAPPPAAPRAVEAPPVAAMRPRRAAPSAVKVQRYYPSNLLRWRYWQFTLFGSILIGVVLTFIFAPLGYLIYVLLPLLGWFWLRVQMACHNCRRRLAVTKVDGQLERCSHCYHPTDNALRAAA